MSPALRPALLALTALAPLSAARAQVTVYTDEAAFLAALANQGYTAVHEGFEDDAAWGTVRTTIAGGPQTAPWIHNLGLTWIPNNANSEITTGEGPARTGQWGFFQLPHGDWANGIRDGFGAVGDQPLVAIGGWVETNTPFAKMGLYLDGAPVDFGGNDVLDTQHSFFGAIDPAGFASFEFREEEATPDDWKLIFSDDFTFAFDGELIDCNQNGIADALDIQTGSSADCNRNGLPDECEIDVNSNAPGGPFFCTQGCDPDCNDNGIPDACDVIEPEVWSSGPLSPIGDGFPQSFLVSAPPLTQGDAVLTFSAYANLAGPDEYVDVDVNGVPVGRVFELDGQDCPSGAPAVAALVVPRDTFNAIVAGGNALIGMVASTEVGPDECDQPSTIAVDLTLMVPSAQDGNGNGVPDSCEGLGTRYCVAAPNSAHAGGAHLYALGSATVADGDFALQTRDLPPGAFGVHFFGTSPVQTPFGDGFRCVAGPMLQRYEVLQADGSGVVHQPVDLDVPPAVWYFVPGTTLDFQHGYRDPAGGPAGFNLSDAVEVTFL